jgi:hypothetical protein
MHRAEYYAYLKKSEEYEQKAASEPDLQARRALETVAREYLRRAEQVEVEPVMGSEADRRSDSWISTAPR